MRRIRARPITTGRAGFEARVAMPMTFLCFQLDGERYIHPVDSIRSIINYQEPSPLPGGPPGSVGMIDIRGGVLTLFSARSLFGLVEMDDLDASKIIVFDTPGGSFGLLVDGVDNILSLDLDRLERPADGSNIPMISGTLEHKGRLLILVDFDHWMEAQFGDEDSHDVLG